MQYNTIQYNTIQYNTIQCNTIQFTIQYNLQYNIITVEKAPIKWTVVRSSPNSNFVLPVQIFPKQLWMTFATFLIVSSTAFTEGRGFLALAP